jgi:hypothetical protein
LTSSYMATWVLSSQASSVSPQTVQSAWPVWGTKYFSSVRLYSAPQLGHLTIVSIRGICAREQTVASAKYRGISTPLLLLDGYGVVT